MPIKTKRWNDQILKNDGWRILICRYRPRALPKKEETWDTWYSVLGPSTKLHADAYGKNRKAPITWDEYSKRYVKEMRSKEARDLITSIARFVSSGKTITLLCSSACVDKTHCHRILLKQLIEQQIQAQQEDICQQAA